MITRTHTLLTCLRARRTAVRQMVLACAIAVSTFSANAQTHQDIHLSNGTVLRLPLADIDSLGFYPNGYATPPVVTTLPVSLVSSVGAQGGGAVGSIADERGLCWATVSGPTTADNVAHAGAGSGSYTTGLTALQGNTTYYVRAFATNTAGTFYGN